MYKEGVMALAFSNSTGSTTLATTSSHEFSIESCISWFFHFQRKRWYARTHHFWKKIWPETINLFCLALCNFWYQIGESLCACVCVCVCVCVCLFGGATTTFWYLKWFLHIPHKLNCSYPVEIAFCPFWPIPVITLLILIATGVYISKS